MNDDIIFYHYDNKTICVLTDIDTGEKFYGEANWDGTGEKNDIIGEFIAEHRALINSCRTYREAHKMQVHILERALTDMKQSKKYNPKSYEAKWIRRLIWEHQCCVKQFNVIIKDEKNCIKRYIAVRCK